MDVNKTTLIGRLIRTPEREGRAVVLTIATRYHTERVAYFTTETVTVYVRGALAAICTRYLTFGSRLYVECHLKRGRFIADEIIMLGHLDARRQFAKVKP